MTCDFSRRSPSSSRRIWSTPGCWRRNSATGADQMRRDIQQFLESWLDMMASNHRSYVTVAIGCTGGQHRSVFLVEELARHFAPRWPTLCRHRSLDSRPTLKPADLLAHDV